MTPRLKINLISPIFWVVLLLSAIVGLVVLISGQRLLRSRAAYGRDVNLYLQSTKARPTVGEVFDINILVDTNQSTVTAASFSIKFRDGVLEPISFSKGTFLTEVLTDGTITPVYTEGPLNARIVLGSGPGGKKGMQQLLAVLRVKAKQATTGVYYLRLDDSSAEATALGAYGSKLDVITPASMTIVGSGTGTPTATATPSPALTPSPTPSPTLTPTPSVALSGSPSPSPTGTKTGDVNGDNRVTLLDYVLLFESFGKQTGQIGFDPRADMAGGPAGGPDGKVNLLDYSVLFENFGT